MQAVIMAGGKGTRLRPLTCERPKPLVPLLDRPIIEYIAAHLGDHGCAELAVTIGYQGEAIQKFLGTTTRYGQRVTYATEPEALGTAGGVRNALTRGVREPFVVVSGDALTDVDLTEVLAFHRAHDGVATLVLSRVDEPGQYGVVGTDETGRIVRFVEKPGPGEAFSDRVNTGIYVFEPEVLEHIPAGRFYDFSRDLFPALMAEGYGLFGFDWPGYWSDVGSLEQYLASQFDLLTGRVRLALPGTELAPGVRVAGGSELPRQVQHDLAGPLYVGQGVSLAPDVELAGGVVLGRGSRIEAGVRLARCLLFPEVRVGAGAHIEGAILGLAATVDAGVEVEAGAVLGDGCRVTRHALVPQGAKLWPRHALVGAQGASGRAAGVLPSGITGEARADRGQVAATAEAPAPVPAGGGAAGGLDATHELVYLGQRFGSLAAPGRRFVIASDCDAASLLARDAVSLGLLMAGVDLAAVDLRYGPAIGYAIGQLRAAGGVYTRQEGDDQARLLLYDEAGRRLEPANLASAAAKGQEPGGEQVVRQAGVGARERVPLMEERYLQHLLAGVELGRIRSCRWRCVAALPSPGGGALFHELADRLNLRLLAVEEARAGGRLLASARQHKAADLALELGTDGGESLLVTDDATTVTGQALVGLWRFLGGDEVPDPAAVDPLQLMVWLLDRASQRELAPGQLVQAAAVRDVRPRRAEEEDVPARGAAPRVLVPS